MWLGGQRAGEIATLSTRGLDGLDSYFARYLPQLVLGVLVPIAVLARVAVADWISAVVIAVTLPLIPVFAVLVGWHTKAQTRRQWRLLAILGGHFLDVVEGLPTLKVFGRARAQEEVIAKVTDDYRKTTMATLRVAFLSALVLELAAAVATALVAVEVGLRLLYGHLGYETALLVLLLTPEAFLPLRAVGAQFHASMEGAAAAGRVFEILDTPVPDGPQARPGPQATGPGPTVTADLRIAEIRLDGITVTYPGRPRPALDGVEPDHRAGGADRADRAERRGQEHAAGPAAPLHGPGGRDHRGGRRRRGRDGSGAVAPADRVGTAAAVPVQRERGRQHRARPARREPRRHRPGRPAGRAPPSSSMRCRPATTRRSGSAACGCPRASVSGSRSPARSCGTLPCCSSTSPPLIWIRPGPG